MDAPKGTTPARKSKEKLQHDQSIHKIALSINYKYISKGYNALVNCHSIVPLFFPCNTTQAVIFFYCVQSLYKTFILFFFSNPGCCTYKALILPMSYIPDP